ncbi:hypothetical protein SAMN04488133_2984 [Halobellus limi]|uniref:Uncharacterized protein n=1 Tax=Halobellus limi TaxID=699433 RepID=A0A1H6BSD7_9EURY|nr:hypothetical protein SAMN04488133_2984 [Halobellus limi]
MNTSTKQSPQYDTTKQDLFSKRRNKYRAEHDCSDHNRVR